MSSDSYRERSRLFFGEQQSSKKTSDRFVRGNESFETSTEPVILTGEDAVKFGQLETNPLEISYSFGDKGSSYRMRKLSRILREASDRGVEAEELAKERYPNMYQFWIDQEEKQTLDKASRKTKPEGIFFPKEDLERIKEQFDEQENDKIVPQAKKEEVDTVSQEQLNELRAKVLRAKLSRSAEFAELEAQYAKMESRFELEQSSSKRREMQKLVDEENQSGTKQYLLASAKSIATDKTFKDNLEHLDTVADNTFSIGKVGKVDTSKCIYCLENSAHLNNDAIVAVYDDFYIVLEVPGTEIYPKSPPCLVICPSEHVRNSVELSESEYRELLSIQQKVRKLYNKLTKGAFSCIFYESSLRNDHCIVRCMPVLSKDISSIRAYMRNELQGYDVNSAREIVDTDVTQNKTGKSYRHLIAQEAEFFHVWLSENGGYARVIEGQWPRDGRLVVRRVIGGMLGIESFDVEKLSRWSDIVGGIAEYDADGEQQNKLELEVKVKQQAQEFEKRLYEL